MVKVIHKTSKVFILFCLAFLAVLGISNVAHAEEEIYDTTVRSQVNSSLQITLPDVINMAVNPATKPFGTSYAEIYVGTNNATGYNMTMYTDDTTLYKVDDATKTIPTLSAKNYGGYTEDDFTVNRWGYRTEDSEYYIPFVSGTQILSSDTNTIEEDRTALEFATKVNYSQPSGIYETSINFVAVANPLPTYIQHMDSYLCTTTPMTVVDNRDEQLYTVQELADGNCWMMDNLNLGAEELTTNLTSRNTNIQGTISKDTFNSWLKTAQSSDVYTSQTQPELGLVDGVDSISGAAYGTLYNFCAASAGTYCYEPNEEAPVEDALQDLCPAGWRLPTGGDYGEFDKLINDGGYQNSYLSPLSEGGLNYARSGTDFGGGSNTGYNGYLWSSSRHDEWAMETINFSTAFGISPVFYNGRYISAGIRCVLGKTRPARVPEYLQDMNINYANSFPIHHSSYTIKDKRDNEEYQVIRLDDGNLWLMENLRLDPTEVSLESLKGNTNASDETLTYLKNGGGSGQYPANGVSSVWTSTDQNSYVLPYIVNTYKNTVRGDVYSGSSSGSYKNGIYYNFCAASAGSYCYSGSGPSNATEDLCPKGWKLPTASVSGDSDFTTLYNAYAPDKYYMVAYLDIPMAGYWWRGYRTTEGSSSSIWSSTSDGTSWMYKAKFTGTYGSSTMQITGENRGVGLPIRCIFKKG